MRTSRFAAAVILALASTASHAQAIADDLAWLGGRWCGGSADERIEEVWLEPADGQSLGLSRTTKDGRLASFEFLRIGPADGGLTYFAQPGGRPPTPFLRSDGGPQWIRFDNPSHDFPQRIEYRREGDTLHAEISGPGREGTPLVIGVDYTRCDM